MPVSVAGASAATFAQRHAGACPQPVSRPTNVRRQRGDDRDAQLIAARLRCGQTMSTTVTDQLLPLRGCKEPVGHGPEA